MPFPPSKNRGSQARQIFHLYVVLTLIGLIAGPLIVLSGIHNNDRDRPSLQWPKVAGKLMQCDEIYHPGGRHSSSTYSIAATYMYFVNNRRYVEHQITLWSPDLRGHTGNFKSTHPVPSPVDVYYDPQNPANAVLIPGADEVGNRFYIIDGSILIGLGILTAFMVRGKFVVYKAQRQQEKTNVSKARPPKGSLPHGYACYQPNAKRHKIGICQNEDEMSAWLGKEGVVVADWKPEDRVIDAEGREYQVANEPGTNIYKLNPTGQTWTYERLLHLAETDRRLPKNDPQSLRRRLDGVPEHERLAVLMKSISEVPTGARWYIAGFLVFLVLFFVAVVFIAGQFFLWLQNHWQK